MAADLTIRSQPRTQQHSRHIPRYTWSAGILIVALIAGLGLALRPATPALGAPLAPAFTLPVASSGGASLSLSSLRGHAVLLNFFNTQCGACLDELATLRNAYRTYHRGGVTVVGVATGGDTAQSARALVNAAHLPYPVVVDDREQSTAWHYGVSAWPISFFVDRQGRVQAQNIGELDAPTIRAGLAQASALHCTNCNTLPPPTLITAMSAAPTSTRLSGDAVFTRSAPPFALRDQNGRLVTLQALHGRVIALTVVSALCTEQCPLVGETLAQVRGDLGRDASRFSIVAISAEPEVDSLAATHKFAAEAGWSGDWHYLTGPRTILSRIWKSYGIYVAAPPPIYRINQSIEHQAGIFLIDTHGNLRVFDNVPFLASSVASSVRALLAGT